MREHWSWPGAVALVLTFWVGGGWAAALILASSPWTDTISEAGANLLSTVGGVLAGGVAGYLGGQLVRSMPDFNRPDRRTLMSDQPQPDPPQPVPDPPDQPDQPDEDGEDGEDEQGELRRRRPEPE